MRQEEQRELQRERVELELGIDLRARRVQARAMHLCTHSAVCTLMSILHYQGRVKGRIRASELLCLGGRNSVLGADGYPFS